MTTVGIIGHAADKFTPYTELAAKLAIVDVCSRHDATRVVSGHCHLGGVDIWAEEIAAALGLPTTVHAPRTHSWSSPGGYRDRNRLIARDSDIVVVIVVKDYPRGYNGMRFAGCYHCGDRNPQHVKSGACWTAWRAREREWVFV